MKEAEKTTRPVRKVVKKTTVRVKKLDTANIASVDVNKIVAKSSKVAALKKEHAANNSELQIWLQNAQKLVDNTADINMKNKLLQKYNAEYAKKQEKILSEYNKKLKAIDKEITSIIEKKAKSIGFDIVLSKASVVCGATEITSVAEKLIK